MTDVRHDPAGGRRLSDDILDCARLQVVSSGAAGLSMRAIATQLHVTPPALYRHVGSRRELLDVLATEAADEFVDFFTLPRTSSGATDHLLAVTARARDWARAHPARYLLAFADPDGRVPDGVAAAEHRALAGLTRACGTLPTRSDVRRPAPRPHRAAPSHRSAADEIARRRARQVWTRLHGILVLELLGHLDALDTDGAEHLAHEIHAVVHPRTAPTVDPVRSVRMVHERE